MDNVRDSSFLNCNGCFYSEIYIMIVIVWIVSPWISCTSSFLIYLAALSFHVWNMIFFICVNFIWIWFSLNKCFVFLKSFFGSFYFFQMSFKRLKSHSFSHLEKTSLLKISGMIFLSKNCLISLSVVSILFRKYFRLLYSISISVFNFSGTSLL